MDATTITNADLMRQSARAAAAAALAPFPGARLAPWRKAYAAWIENYDQTLHELSAGTTDAECDLQATTEQIVAWAIDHAEAERGPLTPSAQAKAVQAVELARDADAAGHVDEQAEAIDPTKQSHTWTDIHGRHVSVTALHTSDGRWMHVTHWWRNEDDGSATVQNDRALILSWPVAQELADAISQRGGAYEAAPTD